jgi:hypothetical protein
VVATSFAEFNRKVFMGALPSIESLPVTWNAKLRKTAGLTYTSRGAVYKVLVVGRTLAGELCTS